MSRSPRARWILTAVLVAMGFVVVGWLVARKQLRDGNDFPIYWQAARDLLDGRSPYDVTSGLHGYVYLPWFALWLVPLAVLPLAAAVGVWYSMNVLLVVATAQAMHVALRRAGLATDPRTLTLATLPLLGLVYDNLVLGQANLLLAWLVAVAVRGALEAKGAAPGSAAPWLERLSRAAMGLAAALKMPAALLVLPLALRGQWRAVAAFVATVGLALAIPFLVTGPSTGLELLGDWRAKVVAPAAAGTLQGSKVIDQSPHAGLRRLLVAEPAFGETRVNVARLTAPEFAIVSRGVAIGLLAAYLLLWLAAPARATPRALLLDLSLGCCAMVQVTGFSLKAQFVVLLLPAWTAATIAWGEAPARVARVLLVLAGALFLASYSDLVGRGASNLMLAYSSMAIGTLLLAVVLALLRYAVATPSPSAGPAGAPEAGTAR